MSFTAGELAAVLAVLTQAEDPVVAPQDPNLLFRFRPISPGALPGGVVENVSGDAADQLSVRMVELAHCRLLLHHTLY